MNYEDFCHIASVCTEQIGLKCRRFFSPSNFMKFEKDESGRISILPFYLYVMRTVKFAAPFLYSQKIRECPFPLPPFISILIMTLYHLLHMQFYLSGHLIMLCKDYPSVLLMLHYDLGFTYSSKNRYE